MAGVDTSSFYQWRKERINEWKEGRYAKFCKNGAKPLLLPARSLFSFASCVINDTDNLDKSIKIVIYTLKFEHLKAFASSQKVKDAFTRAFGHFAVLNNHLGVVSGFIEFVQTIGCIDYLVNGSLKNDLKHKRYLSAAANGFIFLGVNIVGAGMWLTETKILNLAPLAANTLGRIPVLSAIGLGPFLNGAVAIGYGFLFIDDAVALATAKTSFIKAVENRNKLLGKQNDARDDLSDDAKTELSYLDRDQQRALEEAIKADKMGKIFEKAKINAPGSIDGKKNQDLKLKRIAKIYRNKQIWNMATHGTGALSKTVEAVALPVLTVTLPGAGLAIGVIGSATLGIISSGIGLGSAFYSYVHKNELDIAKQILDQAAEDKKTLKRIEQAAEAAQAA